MFTYEELLKTLDGNTQVEVTQRNPEDFMEYSSFSLFYKTPSSGSLTITHVFTSETCDKKILYHY